MAESVGEQPRAYGHYDVESILGRGAMGMVYLARDRRIGRRVALKTVHLEEKFDDESEANEFYKRLQREAELCGALQHPNIVTLYEPGYENDVIAWLATEYVDGLTLRDHMRKHKPLPIDDALRVAEGIFRGLVYAHGKGIVHRDIKPANILLTSAGEAKIADFGIARPSESNLTAVGEMLGTPSYMSPEQVRCTAVTTKSDLFSTGAMLYEMVTGLKPFAAPDVSGILRNVVELDPKPANEVNPEVAADVAALLTRLMKKAPDDRYPTAAAALEDLRKIRGIMPTIEMRIEELALTDAISTLAARAGKAPAIDEPATAPSLTDVDFGDRTPAVGTRTSDSLLRRRVSGMLFFAIVASLLAAFIVLGAILWGQMDESPSVELTDAQVREFNNKRASLENARSLYSQGHYDGSIAIYNSYLKRYPWATVAKEEKAEAEAALREATSAKSKMSVTAKRPRKTEPAANEPPPKKGFWRRVFGNGKEQ